MIEEEEIDATVDEEDEDLFGDIPDISDLLW
jgi:hypothetical protein